MILACASAAHGNNLFGKGYLVAASALLYGALGWAVIGVWGWLLIALVVVWWFVFRTSKQARVELDYMDTRNPPQPRLMDVFRAHYYTGFLTCLSLMAFNYDTAPHLVNNAKFWDCRRPTEFATGLTGDVMMSVLIWGVAAWQ